MRINARYLCLLLGLIFLCQYSANSLAGPYFNSSRKEVDGLSRLAVKELGDARIQVIQMLTELDAGELKKMAEARGKAIEFLQSALKNFQTIEDKVPKQPLVLKANSEDESRIFSQFRNTLKLKKLPEPKTEKDLAVLATTMVNRYFRAVAKANLSEFPKNWKGVREVILSEIDLLSVGNLVSVVWIIKK